MSRQLGSRAEAQQRVLASGFGRDCKSWIEVGREIKRVEQEVIRERAEHKSLPGGLS